MAKLNKKFSELKGATQKKLIAKYGSKAKAMAAHSAARTLEGKKNNPYPSKDEKKAALQIVANDNKVGKNEAKSLLQMGIKPKAINKFVASKPKVNYSNKAATTVSSSAKKKSHAQAALSLTKNKDNKTTSTNDDKTTDNSEDQTTDNSEDQTTDNSEKDGNSNDELSYEEAFDLISAAEWDVDDLDIDDLTRKQVKALAAALGNGKKISSSDIQRMNESLGGTPGGQLNSVLGNTPEYKAGGGTNTGFGALSGQLADKAQTYSEEFDPASDYMKRLKANAVDRMVIDHEKYDRKLSKDEAKDLGKRLNDPNDTQAAKQFKKLTLAEQYDVKKDLVINRLREPLDNTIKNKLSDDLSSFQIGNKGKIKGIKFNTKKLNTYKTADAGLSSSIIEQAKLLGVKDVAGVAGKKGRLERITNTLGKIGEINTRITNNKAKDFEFELDYGDGNALPDMTINKRNVVKYVDDYNPLV